VQRAKDVITFSWCAPSRARRPLQTHGYLDGVLFVMYGVLAYTTSAGSGPHQDAARDR
jgi:hypothetical protein